MPKYKSQGVNVAGGHSHIMLWCFFPFLTPPSPHVILCYVFSNPPFTITWLLDTPPPLANLLILVSWSCNILFFFISLYQNIYYLIFTHTKEMKILDFSIFVKKIFPNNVVLWCSMIITLFLAGLPPPPCYKMLCFSWPPPPLGGIT